MNQVLIYLAAAVAVYFAWIHRDRLTGMLRGVTAKAPGSSAGTFDDFKRLQLRAIELGDVAAQQDLDALMPSLFGCEAVSGKVRPKPPVTGA